MTAPLLVEGKVVGADELHAVVEVVHPDHGGEDLVFAGVAGVGHEHQVMLVEKERGQEEPAGVHLEEVVVVHELWVLAFPPTPNV